MELTNTFAIVMFGLFSFFLARFLFKVFFKYSLHKKLLDNYRSEVNKVLNSDENKVKGRFE